MARHKQGGAQDGARPDQPLRKFIRVTGSRLDRYVEFEFSVNDQDLTVELVLPFSAFDEFCELQQAVVLPVPPELVADLERQAWRARQPGLLRRVKNAAEDAADPSENGHWGGQK